MSTRLTEHLMTYGLSRSAINALADGGYWSLDRLLAAVADWRPQSHATATSPGIKLNEWLNVGGIGPVLNDELMRALDNYERGMPQPWAPSPESGELAEEIIRQIHDGQIKHGDPLTPASHLVLLRRTTTNTATTTHRLLATRGYLAMRRQRPVALQPGTPDYEVRYCPSISEAHKATVVQAVALARRHPGLWGRAQLCRGIRTLLRPLDTVEYDDAARVMTVLVVRWRS